MKSRIALLLILACVSAYVSCVTPGGLTASSTPLVNRTYQNLGPSDGSSNWAGSIFGVWMVNRADINRAVEDAVKKKNGDALINVRWYEKTYYCVLFALHRVYVTGEVIKFEVPVVEDKGKDAEKNKDKKAQGKPGGK